MTTLSHSAVGYLVTSFFIGRGWLPAGSVNPYVLGIAFANLPDIDALVSLRNLHDHHNSLKNLSHYPANWLLVFALTAVLAVPFAIDNMYPYLALAVANVLLHFVLDTFSIYHGIAWLGPWKKKKYSFIRFLPLLPANTRQWVHWYTKHWIMYLEAAIWIVALLVLFSKKW